MEIRKLKTEDVFTVVDMLRKIGGVTGKQIKTLFTSSDDESKKAKTKEQVEKVGVEVAFLLLETCYKETKDDLVAWFASLCQVKPEEFYQLPADTFLDIIEELTTSKDAENFFLRAWSLYKKMNDFADRFKGKKD